MSDDTFPGLDDARGPVPAGTAWPVGAARARAAVDLDAISHNTTVLRSHVQGRDLMAVVKANGYGHGIAEVSRAARAGGATWIGVTFLDEALLLRSAGDRGRLLAWLPVPGDTFDAAVLADVDVAVSTEDRLRDLAAAADRAGTRARVHLKLDTGMARGGATEQEAPALVGLAAELRDAGAIEVVGVMSHLARADGAGGDDRESVRRQVASFEEGIGLTLEAGLEPTSLHLANSPATVGAPETWFTMVRPGVAVYGLSAFGDDADPRAHGLGLRPAMRLSAPVSQVKRVPAGQAVSYGGTYVTERETSLAIVPVGYADGVPRQASHGGQVVIAGQRFPVAGQVCMDQFVADVGDLDVHAGDEAVIWGDPARGEPSVQEWADRAGTIGYDIVTGVGTRVARTYTTSEDE